MLTHVQPLVGQSRPLSIMTLTCLLLCESCILPIHCFPMHYLTVCVCLCTIACRLYKLDKAISFRIIVLGDFQIVRLGNSFISPLMVIARYGVSTS